MKKLLFVKRFLHIGSPSVVLVHIGLAQFYYIVGWNAKGICGYESGNNIYGMYQQFPASPPPQPSPPPRHPLCQLVESLYEFVRVNVRKVDGNGSPLKNAVFGVYDSEEAAKNEDVALARLTTGADGLSQEGGARK